MWNALQKAPTSMDAAVNVRLDCLFKRSAVLVVFRFCGLGLPVFDFWRKTPRLLGLLVSGLDSSPGGAGHPPRTLGPHRLEFRPA